MGVWVSEAEGLQHCPCSKNKTWPLLQEILANLKETIAVEMGGSGFSSLQR